MNGEFITKDGKRLRRGYTTGSCAAAAAKAAAIMLLGGGGLGEVWLMTPAGTGLTLPLADTERGEGYVSCGVVKDSGDDPDVTNGMTVYARVEKSPAAGEITIDGGEGIGRVTMPGLDQPVGSAAINSTPRRMITQALREVCEDCGYTGGLRVIISAPQGTELAKKTFNPRLGIVGGLSILGTTGIVEPMSDEAVVETIRAELSVRRACGRSSVLLTPGNYGAEYIKNRLGISPETAVTTSNFIGDALDLASQEGFRHALVVGHIGKLIKTAGGMLNTHSRYGDCRAEIFAAHAGMCGASAGLSEKIMNSVMTDEMLRLLGEEGLRERVMESIMNRIEYQLSRRAEKMTVGAVVFSNIYGVLGETGSAAELINLIKKEYE